MHEHAHQRQQGRSLVISIILNFLITAVQVIGGLVSNSLSLISDALHNLSDATALLIAWLAGRYGRRKADTNRTFGYRRAEILAAFVNGIILVAVSFYLFYEAWQRFIEPQPVQSGIMLIVASIGLVANLASVLLLRRHSDKSINIRAAYLHLFADTLSSVAVIAGGLLMLFFGWYWIDPLVTVLIGIYILRETYSILKESIDILMQTAPRDIVIDDIQDAIRRIDGVSGIHHVHLWRLTDQLVHFESHVSLDQDLSLSACKPVRDAIEHILYEEFGIRHVTVQFEYQGCEDEGFIAGAESQPEQEHHKHP